MPSQYNNQKKHKQWMQQIYRWWYPMTLTIWNQVMIVRFIIRLHFFYKTQSYKPTYILSRINIRKHTITWLHGFPNTSWSRTLPIPGSIVYWEILNSPRQYYTTKLQQYIGSRRLLVFFLRRKLCEVVEAHVGKTGLQWRVGLLRHSLYMVSRWMWLYCTSTRQGIDRV